MATRTPIISARVEKYAAAVAAERREASDLLALVSLTLFGAIIILAAAVLA